MKHIIFLLSFLMLASCGTQMEITSDNPEQTPISNQSHQDVSGALQPIDPVVTSESILQSGEQSVLIGAPWDALEILEDDLNL